MSPVSILPDNMIPLVKAEVYVTLLSISLLGADKLTIYKLIALALECIVFGKKIISDHLEIH